MISPDKAQSWIVRPCRPDDEEGVTRLFGSVFVRTIPKGYWNWKLRQWPGDWENEWVADACGRIVGHYAVTPLRFKIKDRVMVVPHGCDAMTHPEFRHRGILSALGRRANEVWEQTGSPFQIGFHYGGWGSVCEGLGWRPVCIAYITDGSKSRAGGLNAEEVRSRRRQEAEAAARSFRVNRFEWVGLAEGAWSLEEFCAPMLRLLRELAPQIIYAPSVVDFHPEHTKVANALARLLLEEQVSSHNISMRIYQLQVPLTPVLTNLVADASSVRAESEAALAVYRSQATNLARALRTRRYAARLYGLRQYGEEFWQMPAAYYADLHAGQTAYDHNERFRGVRCRSFGDPLAYLLGFGERMRLRRTLQGRGVSSRGPRDA